MPGAVGVELPLGQVVPTVPVPSGSGRLVDDRQPRLQDTFRTDRVLPDPRGGAGPSLPASGRWSSPAPRPGSGSQHSRAANLPRRAAPSCGTASVDRTPAHEPAPEPAVHLELLLPGVSSSRGRTLPGTSATSGRTKGATSVPSQSARPARHRRSSHRSRRCSHGCRRCRVRRAAAWLALLAAHRGSRHDRRGQPEGGVVDDDDSTLPA